MVTERFEQWAVGSYAAGGERMGMTNIFISQNWDPEKLLNNDYYGIKVGDVLYLKSTDYRVKIDNLRITISYPREVMSGAGGLHAYTNDLVLPKAFHLAPAYYFIISNQPFAATEDKTVMYRLDDQRIERSPLDPIEWPEPKPTDPPYSVATASVQRIAIDPPNPALNTTPVTNPGDTLVVAETVNSTTPAPVPVIASVNPNPAITVAPATSPGEILKTAAIAKTVAVESINSSIAPNTGTSAKTNNISLTTGIAVAVALLIIAKLTKLI